jgi:hypothetical protein
MVPWIRSETVRVLLLAHPGSMIPYVLRVIATKDALEPFHLLCVSRCASRGMRNERHTFF